MREQYEWHDDPPKNNGDFFYSGNTPGGEDVLAIVQITLNPNDMQRWACLFIPPGWRGNMERKDQAFYVALLEEWKGQWSGPEHGLTMVYA